MESQDRRSRVNMQGNEIAAVKPYLDLCEYCRKKAPVTIHEEVRSRFIIFRTIFISLEYLILYAIDIINLIEAFSFAEEAQDPGYYQTTILKHMCVHIDDLNKRLNDQITGKAFQDTINQINTVFKNADSLEVPNVFNQLRREYNQRMGADRQYIHDIRNKIAAHTDSDIEIYIDMNKRIDAERIRSITHYTLSFITKFLKTFKPLKEEAIGGVRS